VFLLVVSVVYLLSWLFSGGIGQLALPLFGGVDIYALGYPLTPLRLEMNGEHRTEWQLRTAAWEFPSQ
jgi:hypothetical protein